MPHIFSSPATPAPRDRAPAAGLDKYRALRSFTAAFGLTPMRYLASLRVESAREALAVGASCAEAATERDSPIRLTDPRLQGAPGDDTGLLSTGRH